MALSNPKGIANLGDSQRVARAVAYFAGTVLVTDPRVVAFYRHWRDASDAFLDSETTDDSFVVERDKLDAWRHTMTDETALFIREKFPELEQWVTWLAPQLQDAFVVITRMDLDSTADDRVYARVRISERTPKGRQMSRDGQDLERNVRWFYRAKVKVPADSIHALAEEEAAEVLTADADDTRKKVREGIKQVNALFDAATRNYTPENRK